MKNPTPNTSIREEQEAFVMWVAEHASQYNVGKSGIFRTHEVRTRLEELINKARIDELERTTWNDVLDNDTKDKLYLGYLKDRIKTLTKGLE